MILVCLCVCGGSAVGVVWCPDLCGQPSPVGWSVLRQVFSRIINLPLIPQTTNHCNSKNSHSNHSCLHCVLCFLPFCAGPWIASVPHGFSHNLSVIATDKAFYTNSSRPTLLKNLAKWLCVGNGLFQSKFP